MIYTGAKRHILRTVGEVSRFRFTSWPLVGCSWMVELKELSVVVAEVY